MLDGWHRVLSVISRRGPTAKSVRNAGRGENKSPAFEFLDSGSESAQPGGSTDLRRHIPRHQNSTNRGTADTLHGPPSTSPARPRTTRGLGQGDLPDGTEWSRHRGSRRALARISTGGPGRSITVFEFCALDTKLDLPATTARDDLLSDGRPHSRRRPTSFSMRRPNSRKA